MSEMKERDLHNCFYIDSLNYRATIQICTKVLQIIHKDYTFKQRNSQDFLVTQKSRLTPCKNHAYRPKITSGTQPKAQEQPNLMVTLPSQPYMCSSS